MFRGQFKHTIDPKGRLSIPAKYRQLLADEPDGTIILVPNDHSLEVHTLREWEETENRLRKLSRFDEDARRLKYGYTSRATDVTLDAQGRLQIPQRYREMTGLNKDVMVVGMMEHFEVWDVGRWTSWLATNMQPVSELFRKVADKGA